MNAEMIAYPNTKLMCSVNVDGAAAAVLASEKKAKELGLGRAVRGKVQRRSGVHGLPNQRRAGPAALRGVLAQRLVRRICKHCKEPYAVTPADERLLSRISVDTTGVETLYRGAGCTTCRNTGFAGRLGIYEYYEPDDAALDAITAGASLQELRRLARDCGDYATLRQEGFAKVRAGLTTLEELLKATTA